MSITPIPKGTLNWDAPLNQQLAQLDANITAVAGSVANTMDTTSNQTVTGTKTFATQTNFVGNTGASTNISSYQNGDTSSRFALNASGTINWGPGNAGTDTNLYRATTGQLQTDSTLAVLGTVASPKTGDVTAYTATYSGPNTTQAAYNYIGAGTTSRYADVKITGDSSSRLAVFADGTMSWGPGGASRDTNLYRSAVNTLKTDNSLIVGTNLSVTGNLSTTGIGFIQTAYKGSTQAIANSTSYSADSALTVALPAAGTYTFVLFLVYDTLSAAGINVRMSYSGTSSFSRWTADILQGETTGSTGNIRRDVSSLGTGFGINGGAGSGAAIAGKIMGSVQATSSGNLFFEWCQNVANVTATNVQQGSYLEVKRVA